MGGPGGPDGRGRGGDQRPGGIPFLQGIKLTEEQREQVRAIMEEGRTDTPPDARLRELQGQLLLAILADAPDAAAIDAIKAQVSAEEAAMLAHRVSVETRIAQILTAEQRAQARAEIGKHRIGGQ
jgi:periplasmic protein CpxP/Spy